MNQMNNVEAIDLWALFLACLRRWWLIVLFTVVGGGLAFGVTYKLITPMYQSTVKLYINNSEVSVGNVSISTSDLSASIQLVDLYAVLLNTKDTLDVVIEDAGLDMDYTTLQDMLSTSSVDDTQVFAVTVTDADPAEAQLIASTVGNVLPTVIENIVNGSEAKIVEHAVVPTKRSSPSYSRNTLQGALAGFVLAVLLIVVLTLLDTTIKSDTDVQNICDVAILAYIPSLSKENARKGYYNKKYYRNYYKSNYTAEK